MIGYDDYLTVEIKNDAMDPIDNIFNYSKELTDIINQTL